MAKLSVMKNGKRDRHGFARDLEASGVVMLLAEEIHKLACAAGPAASILLGADLYRITDAVTTEVAKGPGERGGWQRFTRLSAIRVWLGELEARLILAQQAEGISRRQLQTLLSIISAVRQYCICGSGGHPPFTAGRSIPS